jgi:hypothetical protein
MFAVQELLQVFMRRRMNEPRAEPIMQLNFI